MSRTDTVIPAKLHVELTDTASQGHPYSTITGTPTPYPVYGEPSMDSDIFCPGWNGEGSANRSMPANKLLYLPIWTTPVDIDGFVVQIATAASGGGDKIRVGIYSATVDSNNRITPNELLKDGGQLAADSTGVKIAAISPDLSLDEGYYFLALETDDTAPVMTGLQRQYLFSSPVISIANSSVAPYSTGSCFSIQSISGGAPEFPAVNIDDFNGSNEIIFMAVRGAN